MTDQLHRHPERRLRFLKEIRRYTPKNQQLHLILDNHDRTRDRRPPN